MTPEKKAKTISEELEKLCKKHSCELGVWLNWRDLLHNFEALRKNPEITELKFGIEVRFKDVEKFSNKTHTNNKGKS